MCMCVCVCVCVCVCYESNTTQAEERKSERYADLADNIKKAGYMCCVCPVQEAILTMTVSL